MRILEFLVSSYFAVVDVYYFLQGTNFSNQVVDAGYVRDIWTISFFKNHPYPEGLSTSSYVESNTCYENSQLSLVQLDYRDALLC
jgi:hypothetical protein